MYLHCKQGFVEADAWDGSPLPLPSHQDIVTTLARQGQVIVVRSRRAETLAGLIGLLDTGRDLAPLASPAGWDYQWRVYVTAAEWSAILGAVALGLDYRNFKSWTHDHRPDQYKLAYAIWDAGDAHST